MKICPHTGLAMLSDSETLTLSKEDVEWAEAHALRAGSDRDARTRAYWLATGLIIDAHVRRRAAEAKGGA
jgi:hypothetical protein